MSAWMWWSLGVAFGVDLAVKGEQVHPVSGPVIEDGVVLVEEGRITAVGPAAEVPIPEGVRVVEGAVVTPGFVDGLGTVGLTGILNSEADQDHRESYSPVQPELRALDGFDPWEELLGWVRDHGVTTLHVGPSPGPVVAGRTLLTPSVPGPDLAPDAYVADGMVVFSLGEAAKRGSEERDVSSRMGAAALMRQALAEAREYASRRRLGLRDRPQVDLGTEALVDLLRGRRKALVHAHRADDLLTALRIAREFDIDVVLAGAAEGYLVREALAEAGVDVLVGPVMLRGWQSGEQSNASFRNAALLADAGVRVGFMTGFEGYVPKVRVALWEAAIAAGHGLGSERALKALTLDGASILGIEREVGSLQVGKRADLAVFDGDPFEYTSHVCAVVVGGQTVSETCR
ncbi:MAG: amidohydrolase family protein [Myxococcales bacterium]|nr:amidohydrolase family protein [Myxococcales bacterium]